MSNAAQYAELLNEQILFSNVPYQQWSTAWDSLKSTGTYGRTDNGQRVNAFYKPEDLQKFRDGSSPLTHPNTHWYKSAFKTWTGQQDHTLQTSGCTEAVRLISTVHYQNQ